MLAWCDHTSCLVMCISAEERTADPVPTAESRELPLINAACKDLSVKLLTFAFLCLQGLLNSPMRAFITVCVLYFPCSIQSNLGRLFCRAEGAAGAVHLACWQEKRLNTIDTLCEVDLALVLVD